MDKKAIMERSAIAERRLHERFSLSGGILAGRRFMARKAVRTGSCEGCFFHTDLHKGQCLDYVRELGLCHKSERNDKTSIVFVEV